MAIDWKPPENYMEPSGMRNSGCTWMVRSLLDSTELANLSDCMAGMESLMATHSLDEQLVTKQGATPTAQATHSKTTPSSGCAYDHLAGPAGHPQWATSRPQPPEAASIDHDGKHVASPCVLGISHWIGWLANIFLQKSVADSYHAPIP